MRSIKHLLTLLFAAVLASGLAGGTALLAPGTPLVAHAASPAPPDGRVVVDRGHVDLAPRFVDGAWRVQVRDGTLEPSVWRETDDVVFHVRDTAELTMPDDPAYAFVGKAAGQAVHVVPQTEMPGVVWIGWNTQDPGVIEGVKRQIAYTLVDVEGPGDLLLYLQSGNLTAPQVLWDSRETGLQDIFMDTNVHTHGNWIFTEPGTYLLTVEFAAELADGTPLVDRKVLRFAVGDSADTQAVFDAVPAAAEGKTETRGNKGGAEAATLAGTGPFGLPAEAVTAAMTGVGAVGILAIGVIVAVAAVRGRRAKAAAAAELVHARGPEREPAKAGETRA
ncbi:choice-of-anchor M domain-containing protein [Arthrobacter sp.]|nr:choice-of-anchor M domain-containing protein [Arthrobacter sp.]